MNKSELIDAMAAGAGISKAAAKKIKEKEVQIIRNETFGFNNKLTVYEDLK